MKQLSMLMLLVLSLSTVVFGGSLEPSTAPGPTMKTLDQVEPRIPITSLPYTITASGSYYLTKNLTYSTNTGAAITINYAVNNVTIDLCGYTLTGAGASSGTNNGILINNCKNVEIRNGTVASFGDSGIYTFGAAQDHRVIGIRAVSNGRCGIVLAGSNCLVKDCTASDNGASASGNIYGIYMATGCIATGNTVYNNGASALSGGNVYGIYAINGSTVTGNTVYNNGNSAVTGSSVYGVWTTDGCTITGNTLYSNGSSAATCYGISTNTGCKIADNTLKANYGVGIKTFNNATISGNAVISCTGNGILAGNGCSILNNQSCSNSGYGISTNYDCSITGNTANYNTAYGINAGDNCTISKCTANVNTQRGINAGNNCTIADCTASVNTTEGINAGDRCTVTGNNVNSNGGSGIYCFGGYVARNNVMLNNTSVTVGKGGIVVEKHSQVKENILEGNVKNNIYVVQYRNSVEGNVMSGSDYGINFGSTGNVYRNNLATANGGNNVAGNTDGGGNNLAF